MTASLHQSSATHTLADLKLQNPPNSGIAQESQITPSPLLLSSVHIQHGETSAEFKFAHSATRHIPTSTSLTQVTLPFLSYWEPWHGQANLLRDLLQGTTQPK